MSRILLDRRSTMIGGAATALMASMPRIARAADTPRRGGVLTAQTFSDLRTLNPAMRTSFAIHVFTSKMVEPLVDLDADGQPAGKLAVAWKSSPDGRTITFKLREGVLWHDGKPFTSADVQFCALEMWRKYQNFGTLLHKSLSAVDTPDAHTAVFHYDNPMPLGLLLRASAELCYVVPRHVFEGTDLLNNPANNAPIGTGPYKFSAYVPGEHVIMERNPNYWMPGLPYLDRLIVRVISDPPAATAALESGDVDMSLFSSLPRTDFSRLSQDSRFRVSSKGNEANPLFNTIGFNTRRKELADVRVRQAILHALDIDFYAHDFDLGYSKRAQGPWPTTSSFFVPGVPDYNYDPKKAEALLDEAGLPRGPDGTRLKMRLMPNTSEGIHTLAIFIQQSLQKIGIKLDDQVYDSPGYMAHVNRDWDFEICTDTSTFRGDPAVGSTIWYRSGIPPGTPWSNQWGWKSDQIDQLIDAAAVELDPAKRKDLYHQVAVIANTEVPVWMALEQLMVSAVGVRVRNDHNMPRWPASSWADVWLAA
jgi:peptide/nickel transport system substrate-binding protein